ncbi:MAG: hypothetical protein IKE91_02375 [Clostridia bacterium]|nr:hypothetical protein [Clostridia bacterium]
MAFKFILILFILLVSLLIAHLIVFNVTPTKAFIRKAFYVTKVYNEVYKKLLSGKIDKTDEPKEATYKGITIRYYGYNDLSDSVLKMVEDAIRSYRDMETIYQNVEQTRHIYSTLVDIKLEVERLRQKYCEE